MAWIFLAYIVFVALNLHHAYANFSTKSERKSKEKLQDTINLFDTLLKREKGIHTTLFKSVMIVDLAEIAFSLFMCYATYSITNAIWLLPCFVIILFFTFFEVKRIKHFVDKVSDYNFKQNPIVYMTRYISYIKRKNYTFITYYMYTGIGVYGLLNFLKMWL